MDNTEVTSGYARSANCQARDMEFVALYNPTLQLMIERGSPAPRRHAIHFVINNGHPRYHVSFKRAYEVVCQLLRHGKKPTASSLQVAMWHEIAGRVAQLCASDGMSIARAVEFVLEHCRANRFYISDEYADTILDRARRQYRQRKLHATRHA